MPFISLDVHATTLIDAQLSLSFSQLSDVLRLVIEQSNSHEKQIQELNAQLQTSMQRNDALAQQLAEIQGGANAHGTQASMLSEMSTALQLLREEVFQLKGAQREQSDLKAELAQLKRQLAEEKQSTSVAFSTVQEKWAHLSHAMKDVQPQAQYAAAFADLWGATSTDVDSTHLLEEAAQRKYILSLPPMVECLSLAAANGNDNPNSGDEQPWVAKADWVEHLSALKAELASLQSDLTALQRQRHGGETFDAKLKEIEEKLRVLDATKADHLSLSMKTDKDTTNGLAQRVNQTVNELGNLSDRIDALVQPAHAEPSVPKKPGTVASPPVIPVAAALPSDDLRRRVAALETEVTNLETKKADRSEMTKLYDALDTLTRNSPLGLQTTGEAHASPPQPPKAKPPSARGSRQGANLLDHVAVVDAHLPPVDMNAIVGSSRGSSASPRRGVTPSRPLFVGHGATVGIRDSSGGMTPASVTCVSR